MDIEEARRLDLVDQQHELVDRLFMLCHGLTNYVIVSLHERQRMLVELESLTPASEHDREEFERLRAALRDLTHKLTEFDSQFFGRRPH